MNELDKKRWKTLFAVMFWGAQAFYVLFPFDLIPDFIPIIGWLDDLVAFAGLIATTIWVVRTVSDIGLDRLLQGEEPTTIDAEPYDPIPTDVLRGL